MKKKCRKLNYTSRWQRVKNRDSSYRDKHQKSVDMHYFLIVHYNSCESGRLSRVCAVRIFVQFGGDMPMCKNLNKEQKIPIEEDPNKWIDEIQTHSAVIFSIHKMLCLRILLQIVFFQLYFWISPNSKLRILFIYKKGVGVSGKSSPDWTGV